MVERGGFEPPKAEPADLQSAPFGHSGTPPTSCKPSYSPLIKKIVNQIDCVTPISCLISSMNLLFLNNRQQLCRLLQIKLLHCPPDKKNNLTDCATTTEHNAYCH